MPGKAWERLNHQIMHCTTRVCGPTSTVSRVAATKEFEGSMPVAGKCDVCGKAKTFGNNVSFSKRRTSRDFRPNVHKKRIIVNGIGVRLNICTRCQRTLGKAGKAA